MKVTIVSPEKTLFEGEVSSIKLPGEQGRFEVLSDHAPLISTLSHGNVVCDGAEHFDITINGGFVEVACNQISVCVEL